MSSTGISLADTKTRLLHAITRADLTAFTLEVGRLRQLNILHAIQRARGVIEGGGHEKFGKARMVDTAIQNLVNTPLEESLGLNALHLVVKAYSVSVGNPTQAKVYSQMTATLLRYGACPSIPFGRKVKQVRGSNGTLKSVVLDEGRTIGQECRDQVPPVLKEFFMNKSEGRAWVPFKVYQMGPLPGSKGRKVKREGAEPPGNEGQQPCSQVVRTNQGESENQEQKNYLLAKAKQESKQHTALPKELAKREKELAERIAEIERLHQVRGKEQSRFQEQKNYLLAKAKQESKQHTALQKELAKREKELAERNAEIERLHQVRGKEQSRFQEQKNHLLAKAKQESKQHTALQKELAKISRLNENLSEQVARLSERVKRLQKREQERIEASQKRQKRDKRIASAGVSCPNSHCTHFGIVDASLITRKGYRRNKHNGQRVQRLECKGCGTGFSTVKHLPTAQQHRPEINDAILDLLVEGRSMEAVAKAVGCSETTVERKFKFLVEQARSYHHHHGIKRLSVDLSRYARRKTKASEEGLKWIVSYAQLKQRDKHTNH